MTHPLLIDTITDPLTHLIVSLLSDAHSARLLIITVPLLICITHGLVLYLDTDRHVYKSPLKVH
jgi:hypothetical protein